MSKIYAILCFWFLTYSLNAQNQLALYKTMFVKRQNSLSTTQLDIDFATLEYEKAKKNRYPSIRLNGQYSLRNGGREYEIPTGTLLNSVYNNLTYFNSQNYPDGTNTYPKTYDNIENTSINFLRTKEYDASLTTSIPIINFSTREHINAKKLEQELSILEYEQTLIKEWNEFKINYFSYFKRKELVKLIKTNIAKRETFFNKLKSLRKNHKVIDIQLKKVELDMLEMTIERKTQEALLANDKDYLLDALNQKGTGEILLDEIDLSNYPFHYTQEELLTIWVNNNAGLKLLNHQAKIFENKIIQTRAAYKPNLNLLLSAGVQGENFDLDQKPLYLVGALRFDWNIYNPKKKLEDKQRKIIAKKSSIENVTIEKDIKYNIQVLYDKIKLEQEKLAYNKKYIEYNEIKKSEIDQKRKEGRATIYDVYNAALEIETAQLNYTTSSFDYLIYIFQLEKLIGVELFEQ